MQYELRTQVTEPKRQTYTYLAERFGDRPATRYEEGSVDIQSSENFQYRPMWAPDHELYDETFSAMRLTDPDGFTDPRQYYYAPYVSARTRLHEEFAKTLSYAEQHGMLAHLPASWQAVITGVLLPLRHYEAGAELATVNGVRFCYGSTLAQCLTYAGFDRIGNAQLLTRLGFAVGAEPAHALGEAKHTWVTAPTLQPLRKLVEQLLVEPDWAVGVLGIDLVDQMLYPVLYQHLESHALVAGAPAYGLLARHVGEWYLDHRKWLDALISAWLTDPEHAEGNRAALTGLVTEWFAPARTAVADVAALVEELVPDSEAISATATATTGLTTRLADLGLTTREETLV